jgi:hypothetical protein
LASNVNTGQRIKGETLQSNLQKSVQSKAAVSSSNLSTSDCLLPTTPKWDEMSACKELIQLLSVYVVSHVQFLKRFPLQASHKQCDTSPAKSCGRWMACHWIETRHISATKCWRLCKLRCIQLIGDPVARNNPRVCQGPFTQLYTPSHWHQVRSIAAAM